MTSDTKSTSGSVPGAITFGYKVLQIPTLEEMGIPMAGYAVCSLSERLRDRGYETCWINRGDPLLRYDGRCFQGDNPPFLSSVRGDPLWHQSFEIVSPVSGLLLSTRPEQTVGYAVGLQYECCDEERLPVILVPNDEPPPDSANFYVYDRIAHFLRDNFDRIPIRDRTRGAPERLRDYIARSGRGEAGDSSAKDNVARRYNAHLDTLRNRNPKSHRVYHVRGISAADTGLVNKVQNLRAKDIHLREKLVHIAREHGEAI